MMGAWMLYVLLFSSALAVAARVLEHALSRAGWPLRWPWGGAIAASVLLPPALAIVSHGRSGRGTFSAGADGIDEIVAEAQLLTVGGLLSPSALEHALLFGWIATSLAFLGVLLFSAAALRRGRRRWRRSRVAEETVLLSESTGPAVAGFWRPVIVLPAWVLSWEEPSQRLIVAHEREHVRAGDPRLLWGALAALVLTPWNLPLWWCFHRLRFAIELDCDARVLQSPISRRAYGALLLQVAAMPRRRSLAVAAFASERVGLEARVRLLARREKQTGGATGLALAGLVLLLPFAVHTKVPAPRLPDTLHLAQLASPGVDGAPVKILHGPRSLEPPLPFFDAPTPEEQSAIIEQHHPAVLSRGIASEEALWFIIDHERRVLHTGVGRGSVPEIQQAVRARHLNGTQGHVLHFEHKLPEGGRFRSVWLIQAPGR